MAPLPEVYFPSLDACLSGDTQLISWKAAFLRLLKLSTDLETSDNLHRLLSSADGVRVLSNPFNPFPPASERSKSDFDLKTAAINVAPASKTPYNFEDIKQDSLWLSKQAKIDEVAALRIVILEWQNRPNNKLLNKFSDEEVTSLQDAIGAGNLAKIGGESQASRILQQTVSQGAATSATLSKEDRQRELFKLYLSEKLHILKLSQRLLGLCLREKLPYSHTSLASYDTKGEPLLPNVKALASSIFKLEGQENGSSQDDNISPQECINAVRSRLTNFETGSGCVAPDNPDMEIELAWQTNTLEELVQVLQTLFLRLQLSKTIPSSKLVLSWLQLMAHYEFLEHFQPSTEEQVAVFGPLQAIISVTTLAFLKVPAAFSYFDMQMQDGNEPTEPSADKTPFFMSRESVGEINEIFLNAANMGRFTASPAIFGWGIIMYSVREIALATKEEREMQQVHNAVESFNRNRFSLSPGAVEQSIFEDVIDRARNPVFDDDFVKFLVSCAISRCRLFDYIIELTGKLTSISAAGDDQLINQWMRVELLDLVGASINFLDYIPEVVSSALSLISETGRDWRWPVDCEPVRCDPKTVFLDDTVLTNKIFKVAKSRFPYEAVNFLKICRALSGSGVTNDDGLSFIAQELAEMETYTHLVSPGFQGYSSTREDENANFVSLIRPLEISETTTPREQAKASSQSQELIVADMSLIPADTIGQVVNESKPPVIMWHHKYNGLSFLGKWLEQATNNRSYGNEPDDETVAEIVGLFADLISSSHHNAKVNGTESGARRILEMASDGLESYSDIISVVFDIFERNLQSTNNKSGANRDLSPIISCLQFINALVSIIPGRVWPFLARSSFVGSDGKGGTLASTVSSVEASSGNFPFLLASIRTFDALIDDAIRHAAIRRTVGKVSATSDHVSEFSAGIPSYTMRNFLFSFLRTMVEVFNGNSTWRYNDPTQQLDINGSLATIFEKILYYGYGVNDTTEPGSKLTGLLSTSAQYLLSILRPTSSVLPFSPILRTILNGIQVPTSTRLHGIVWLQTRQVKSALCLSERLIQAGRLNGSPTSPLDKQLFNASPVLIRLYALCPDYQLPIVTLLELLVTSAALHSADEPPSLLGHLGAGSCCSFLDSLSKFDRPFNDAPLYVAIWELLTSIISKRQQWLAVFLLTGASPRQSLKQSKEADSGSKMNGRPFLQTSLDLVSNIDSIPLTVTVSALEFVSKAQENWPWATPEIKKHPHFFPKMLHYVTSLDMRRYSPLDCCLNTKIAALAADICAIYLHTAKEARDWAFFKTLIPLVSWLSNNAVEVDGYNASLHANLKKNFEMKYPGCSLVDIKRTAVARPKLGSDYFYDIDLGTKLFGYHFAWAGSKQQGFVDEVKRANLNLSLVETQTTLLHSWKFFAIEHCTDFMPDREVQKSMARVVRQCLVSNSRDVPNEHIFHRLQQTRAEFSLGLLQRLVDVKSRGSEVFELLKVAWDTIRLRSPTYENALVNGDTEYYGSLLNILFLALQFHVAGPSRSAPEALSKKPEISSDLSVVLEIIKNVVAQGFRSLTTYLHEEPQKCSPKDFAILTAILQTALRVKDAERIYEQISYHLADMDTPRYAATLFSWSYKLTVEGDPIYGELSMLFLLELSCIPSMAEQLAVDGLLMKLSTYRLIDVLRQPQGCGPFDPIPRLFAIWHAGILPLCLNLVYHVGRTAPDVAAFLNQFEGPLNRASNCFSIGHATAASSSFSASQRGLARSQSATGLSLGMASEACSLALLSVIIEKFRNAGASAGVDAQSIQELKWDRAQVKDDIEALLEKRSVLRSRIAPTNEKELALSRRAASDSASGAQSQLEERIVKELQTAVMCIGGADGV